MSHDPAVTAASPVDRRERARRLAALAVGALIAVFAVVNVDDVPVDWVVTTTSTPLIVVIGASFLLGLAGGYLLRGRRARTAGPRRR